MKMRMSDERTKIKVRDAELTLATFWNITQERFYIFTKVCICPRSISSDISSYCLCLGNSWRSITNKTLNSWIIDSKKIQVKQKFFASITDNLEVRQMRRWRCSRCIRKLKRTLYQVVVCPNLSQLLILQSLHIDIHRFICLKVKAEIPFSIPNHAVFFSIFQYK